ncbi:MAG: flagellar basal body rod protein FlgC [Thalassococcus sp.]|uniref:flagellar basal body rod protein FlgC n=1 Tax=Thalassococcus sp. TaxID=1928858 RepID=UPI001B27F0FD|nr:flagellar basal body rod protein FlgC [Thalassococcus sp.]MBO6867866.1 flagellar basal body rod protein FlgC [Thalassococcus sp.]
MTVKNVFDVAQRAMTSQLTRLNTVASNLANVNSVSGTEEGAYRAMRPVFKTIYAENTKDSGLSSVGVERIVQLDRAPERLYQPEHPEADADGFVYQAVVNTEEEMVEMMEASRQYQNTVEVISTMRALMARTVNMGQ